jgi:hypothetical protein
MPLAFIHFFDYAPASPPDRPMPMPPPVYPTWGPVMPPWSGNYPSQGLPVYPSTGPVLPPWSGNYPSQGLPVYPSTGPVYPGGPVDPGYGVGGGLHPSHFPVYGGGHPANPIYFPPAETKPTPPGEEPPPHGPLVIWIPGLGYVVATPAPPTKPVEQPGAEPKPGP